MAEVEKVTYRVAVKSDPRDLDKLKKALEASGRKITALRDKSRDLAMAERRLSMQRKESMATMRSLRSDLRSLLAERRKSGKVTRDSIAAEKSLRAQMSRVSGGIESSARAARKLARSRADLADETEDLARAQRKLRRDEAKGRHQANLARRLDQQAAKLSTLRRRELAVASSTRKLRGEIEELNSALRRTSVKHIRDVGRGFRGLGSAAVNVGRTAAAGAAVAAAGITGLGGKVAQTGSEFESLRTSLTTVTGSTAAANIAFGNLQKFASETPFDLQQVVGGFIKLKARGLDPSERTLKAFGNTASAMGKSLDQMIEAVADATTGEFERLKEFGIKSSKAGDQVTFTFQGVKTTVGANAKEINEFLTSLGENQFAGGMERQAKTLNGMLSNLGDAVSTFADEVFTNEFGEALKEGTAELIALVSGSDDLAKSLGETLADVVRDVVKWIKDLAGDSNNVRETFMKWVNIGKDVVSMLMTIVSAVAALIEKLGGAASAVAALGIAVAGIAGPFGALAAAAAAAGVAMADAFESAETRAIKFSAKLLERQNKLRRAITDDLREQVKRNEQIAKLADKDATKLSAEERQFLEENAPGVATTVRRRIARDKGFEGKILEGEKLGRLRETSAQKKVNEALKRDRDKRARAAGEAAARRARREGLTLEEAKSLNLRTEAQARNALETKIKRARLEAAAEEKARVTGRVEEARRQASKKFGAGGSDRDAVQAALAELDPAAVERRKKREARKDKKPEKPKLSAFEKLRKKDIEARAARAGQRAADQALARGETGKQAARISRRVEKETKKRLAGRDQLPDEVDRAKLRLAGFADVAGGRQAPPIVVNNNKFDVVMNATFDMPEASGATPQQQAQMVQASFREQFENMLREATLNIQSEVIG